MNIFSLLANKVQFLVFALALTPPTVEAVGIQTINTELCEDPALKEAVVDFCPTKIENLAVTPYDLFALVEYDIEKAAPDSKSYIYLLKTNTPGVCPTTPSIPEMVETDDQVRDDDGYLVVTTDVVGKYHRSIKELDANTEYCAYVYQNWLYNDSNVAVSAPFTTTALVTDDPELPAHLQQNSQLGIPEGCMGQADDPQCLKITHLPKDPAGDLIIRGMGLIEDCQNNDPTVCGETGTGQSGEPGESELNSIRYDVGTVNPAGFVSHFGQSINLHDSNTPVFNVTERTAESGLSPLVDTTEWYDGACDDLNIPINPAGVIQGWNGLAYDANLFAQDRADAETGDAHYNTYNPDTGELIVSWRSVGFGTASKSAGCQAKWDLSQRQVKDFRGLNCTSTNAAGIPYAPYLVTADEIASDKPIRHKLAITIPNNWIKPRYIKWDGVHAAGGVTHISNTAINSNYFPPGWDPLLHDHMPYGTVTRWIGPIPSSLNRMDRKILETWRDYGAVLIDGGEVQPMLALTNDALSIVSWTDSDVLGAGGTFGPLTLESNPDFQFEWNTDNLEVVSDLSQQVPLGVCQRESVVEVPVNPVAQCADGIDNDGDGLTDLADPGCADAADDDESNTAPPPACTVPAYAGPASEFTSAIGSIFTNMTWTVPPVVAATNNETSRTYRDGFLDVTWADGYQGYVVDPTGTNISTGLQYIMEEAATYDLNVYFPPGTYLYDRTLLGITWGANGPINSNCSKANAPNSVGIYGHPDMTSVLKLADTPAFDFDDVNNPRNVLALIRWDGTNCTDFNYNVNGQDIDIKDSNGFNSGVFNMVIDLNGHAGAVGLDLKMAQSTIAENVHVKSTNKKGIAFGQMAVRTSGGKNLSAENVDVVFDWAFHKDANPGVVGVTARNFNQLVKTEDRTPAFIVGAYLEYDAAAATRPLIEDTSGGFAEAAGAVELADSVIYVTNDDATDPLIKWDRYGRSLTLRNVAVFGKTGPLVDVVGSANDVTSLGAGWQQIEEFAHSQQHASGTFNTATERYTSYPGITHIQGTTNVRGIYTKNHTSLGSEPVGLWERHWDKSNLNPFKAGTLSLLNDFCIPNDGSRAVGNDIQAVFDAGHEDVFFGKGVWVLDDGQEGLTLGTDTHAFAGSPFLARMFMHPDTQSPDADNPVYLINTLPDPTDVATATIKGFFLYTRGRNDESDTAIQTVNPNRLFGTINWGAGSPSRIDWNRVGQYNNKSKNKRVYRPVDDVLITGGGTIFGFTNIDKAESGLSGTASNSIDYRPFVVRNNTGALSYFGPNDEHKQWRADAHRHLDGASNVQFFGNKVECTNGFADIVDSDNISLSVHGLGCRPFHNVREHVIKIEDSTNIRMSQLMPHDWPENEAVHHLIEVNNGTESTIADHGEGVGLYEKGDFDHTVFNHGNTCDTSSLWGTDVLIRPEQSCPALIP